MKWLKKYWWVIAIIVAPIAINFILQIPAFVCIIGDNTDWLTFWGSYLGTIISTLTALFVLFRTLQQNHEENEWNRLENEKANEQNRQLQIKVLEYQQQMQWLNAFRQASAQYTQIYNINDLVEISNMLIASPTEACSMIKSLYDRTRVFYTQLLYVLKEDGDTTDLMGQIDPKFDQYNDVLQDLQQIITFRMTYPHTMFGTLVEKISTLKFTQVMIDKIKRASNPQSNMTRQPFLDVALERVRDIKGAESYVRGLLYAYIQSEQARINKILEN